MSLAEQVAVDLAACRNAHSLRLLFPRLTALVVTGKVLQQSPSVLEALVAAARRCRKSKDTTVVHLLSTWRKVHMQQEEHKECRIFQGGQLAERHIPDKT